MGIIREPEPAKLFVGILTGRPDLLPSLRDELQRHFGAIETESPPIPFTVTRYYEEEMGSNLARSFLSFESFFPRERLVEAKETTQAIEASQHDPGVRRPINLDPGYLTLSKVVLASTKDYAHRIWLGRGIYADLTLQYRQGKFHPLPWTYSDYQSTPYHTFFHAVRNRLAEQISQR